MDHVLMFHFQVRYVLFAAILVIASVGGTKATIPTNRKFWFLLVFCEALLGFVLYNLWPILDDTMLFLGDFLFCAISTAVFLIASLSFKKRSE